jgi:hypothetical protein
MVAVLVGWRSFFDRVGVSVTAADLAYRNFDLKDDALHGQLNLPLLALLCIGVRSTRLLFLALSDMGIYPT